MKELKVAFDFNEDADVLHISLGTGEPSYCEEIDDILLVERGYFSGQITGFQIMDVTYHRIQSVGVVAFVKKALKEEKNELQRYLTQKSHDIPLIIQDRLSTNRSLRKLLQEQEQEV